MKIWDMNTGRAAENLAEASKWQWLTDQRASDPNEPIQGEINATTEALSPDGHWLAKSEPNSDQSFDVRVTSAASGDEVTLLAEDARAVAFSPDRRWLAVTNQGGALQLLIWPPRDLMTEACSRITKQA